jgi:tripartite-type tricarboxylate transporter receptor subunit TctC
MIRLRQLFFILIAAFVFLGTSRLGSAADNYSALDGKVVRVIIGSAVGESTDLFARAFFKSMKNEIPNADFRIQNLESGNKALEELHSASEGNGIVILVTSRSPFFKLIVKPDAKIDPASFKFLGSLGKVNRILAIRKSYGEVSIDQIVSAQKVPLVGAIKPDPSAWEPLLINAITKLKMKVIVGMSEGERQAMIMKGDIDARVGSLTELQPFLDDETMVPLLKFTRDGYPSSLDSIPALSDIVLPDTDKEVLSAIETIDRVGAVILTAAKMPDDKTETQLRSAISKVVEDEDFKAMADKLNAKISFTPGKELTEILARLLSESGGVPAKLRNAIECGQHKSDGDAVSCK